MGAQINWTSQAATDLKDIFDYISRDSPRYAYQQIAAIRQAVHILKKQPFAGRVVPEYDLLSVREIIRGNYRIIYATVLPGRIDILAVHHGAKDFRRYT